MKKIMMSIPIVLVLVVVLSACQQTIPTKPFLNQGDFETSFDPDQVIQMKTFASEEQYQQFIRQSQGSYGYPMMMARDTMDTARVMEESANGASAPKIAGGDMDYSETNVQVEGVDEGDIIKTDGEYIYTISGNTLYIVKAYPGEDAELISSVSLENYPTGLFINDDQLVLFGTVNDLDILNDAGMRISNGMTFVTFYDISNKENIEETNVYYLEGRYTESRMLDGEIYILTNVYLQYRLEKITPLIVENDVIRTVPVSNMHFFTVPYNDAQFVGIYSFGWDRERLLDSEMIAVEGQPTVYMSHNNIYLGSTEYVNEWELMQDVLREVMVDRMPEHYLDLIDKIESTDPEVLSPAEKENKINQLYQEYLSAFSRDEQESIQDEIESEVKDRLEKMKYFEYTVLQRVAVDDGSIRVASYGKVPGQLNNQFSMDEYEGVLRVATTLNARWSQFRERAESMNNIYTVDQNMNQLGELTDLAEGERIYSSRFVGERLYLVTFRQVDPFFVIDLSNPANPKMLGELKIPGFSRYLHPYDENTLIGIGRDATDTGRQLGLKISLFDVSDVNNPEEIAKYVASNRYAQTSAEWEHKAFLFDREKELLVIPAYSYDGGWDEPRMLEDDIAIAPGMPSEDYVDEKEGYNGALVFKITRDDIELRGLIDHSFAARSMWQAAVERSLFIEDVLYTKSEGLLRLNALDTLNGIKDIYLKESPTTGIPVY